MKKAVLYINQFFAGIGGEEKTDYAPELRIGTLGPGLALQSFLQEIEITHTIICGDNYMASNEEEGISKILEGLESLEMDLFFAGPAFQAGRYGYACGRICQKVQEQFKIPVFSSMHEENPGVELFRKEFIIFIGGRSAANMKMDVQKMADYANRLMRGETMGWASKEGYFGRGIRRQVWTDPGVTAAKRGVKMLLQKMSGETYQTELPIPLQDLVPGAPPLKNLKEATIALITTGGIVPLDNPHRIQSASATRWGAYDISGIQRLTPDEYKTIHAGFDPAAADADPNIIVPLDALRELESEGFYKKLYHRFFSTVGTGTTQAEAQRMGKEMISELKENHVDGVLLVST